MLSVLWVTLISLDFFSLQFYPANSLNILEIFDHNRYDLHLFIAHTITISPSSDLSNFFVNADVTLLAPICSSRNSYVDVNSFIGQVIDSTSTQNTAYMTRSIFFGQLQLGHRCYVFTKLGKRGDSVDFFPFFFSHKGVGRAGWWLVPCAYWLNFNKLAYLSIGIVCAIFLESFTVHPINLNKNNKLPAISLIFLAHDAFVLGSVNVGTLPGDISVKKL